jgi:hypothetical protein
VKVKEFGPNQDRVDAVLARLESVDYGEALLLASLASDASDDPDRARARDAVREAARRGGRDKALRAAQDEVRRWVNRWYSGGPQISGYGRDITPAQAALDAAPAVLDAVGAMVVGDLLPAEDVETLMGPWQELPARARAWLGGGPGS